MASTPVRCNSKRAGRSSVKARKSNKTSEIIIIDDDNDEEDETKGLDQQCPHSTYQEGKSTGRKRKSSQEKEPAIKKKQRLNPGNRKENVMKHVI